MRTDEVERLARELMDDHGLQAWRFRFDRSKKRFGRCEYTGRKITLSRHLVALNDEDQCRDTILHEIAHALAPAGCGHDWQWKATCRRIGARPVACYTLDEVVVPPAPWYLVCESCGIRIPRYRKPMRRTVESGWHRKDAGKLRLERGA